MKYLLLAISMFSVMAFAVQPTTLSPVLKQRFFDSNALPLAGGKVYSYVAGTTTPLLTYTDATGTAANTNPVTLDSAGYANIWMGPSCYKFILKDSNLVTQFTVDQVCSPSQELTLDSSYAFLNGQSPATTGDSWNCLAVSSVVYFYEVIRGTTVSANGRFVLQCQNATWRLVLDGYNGDNPGITLTVVQVGTFGNLFLAANSGAGNGTIKFKKFPYSK